VRDDLIERVHVTGPIAGEARGRLRECLVEVHVHHLAHRLERERRIRVREEPRDLIGVPVPGGLRRDERSSPLQ